MSRPDHSSSTLLYKLSNDIDISKAFEAIDVDKAGIAIMAKKSKLNFFLIPDLNIKATNILKQDSLSIGAELATSRHAADFSAEKADAILICSDKQLEMLSRKELPQPFGLKEIAKSLSLFTHKKVHPKQLMGVLNINFDSFYASSRTGENDFLSKVEVMIADGADIIDIGGVSSRPGSIYPGEDEERRRLEPIFQIIKKEKLYERVIFSADTFSPAVARMALDSGFGIINDITGLEDDNLAKIIAEYSAKVVIMHKKGTSLDMQELPHYDNIMLDIDGFFDELITKALSYGVKDIILDIGIGFGKTLRHNITLIQNMEHFARFGYPLLIGASRKSMINEIDNSAVTDRLAGTISIHQKALDNGVSIIRAHDVREHVQMMKTWQQMVNFC